MLSKEEIVRIAKEVDPFADLVSEFPKGIHFMRESELFSSSDPGFAVSREDGMVYSGFAAQVFLFGDPYEITGFLRFAAQSA